MRVSLFISVCTILLAACGGKNGDAGGEMAIDSTGTYFKFADAKKWDSTWSKENTVVYHTTALPDNLHPTNGLSSEREFVFRYTQMSLLNNDLMARTLRPQLVKSLPTASADGLQFSYELIDNATWDDGSPLTVEDVIFTFKANKCPLVDNAAARGYLTDLLDIKADPTNNKKFTVVMGRKYLNMVAGMSDFPIMQRKAFDSGNVLAKYSFAQLADTNKADIKVWAKEFNNPKYGDGSNAALLSGIGPYKVAAWEDGVSLTLVKKANHWTDKLSDPNPHDIGLPEKIIFKVDKDPNVIKLGFKAQKYDGSGLIQTIDLRELQKDPEFNKNYNSYLVPGYGWAYLAFNMKPDGVKHKKFFTDKNVRRAIALLVPADDIIKTVRAGNGLRIATMVSPLKKDEVDTTLKPLPLDIEKAKKLLDEAGWKDTDGDGIRDKVVDGQKIQMAFEFNFPNVAPAIEASAKLISEALGKAGIKAKLLGLDAKMNNKRGSTHDFDLMYGQWGGNSQPEDYTQVWLSSAWADGGSNIPGFGDAKSDAIIDSIRYANTDAQRIKFSKQLQKLVYDEQPYVFLYAPRRCVVLHKRFGNTVMVNDNPNVMLNYLKLLSPSLNAKN